MSRARIVVLMAVAMVTATACRGHDAPDKTRPVGSTQVTPDSGPDADGGYGPARLAGRIADPAVTESSGLVASRRNPGLLWTHNDSGGGPVLYCLRPDATSCGSWRVQGASAFDWEDIAAGPGAVSRPEGSSQRDGGSEPDIPYLYIGDIGDNAGTRASVVVYRVPEPAVTDAPQRNAAGAVQPTAPVETLRLSYPDGPHDAETLLVHPTSGDLYIVTKEAVPKVYKAPAPLVTGSAIRLTLVASLPPAVLPFDRITGGDIAPDGRRVVLSTYLDGQELELPAGDIGFDNLWGQTSRPVDLGVRDQGESVAYSFDGKAVLATSEGKGAPLYKAEQG